MNLWYLFTLFLGWPRSGERAADDGEGWQDGQGGGGGGEKVSGAGRAGGVLLASRPWRLPRRTTHIVASRTERNGKRDAGERKEGRQEKRREREKETGEEGKRAGPRDEERRGMRDLLCLDRTDVSTVHCVHQVDLLSFRPSFLPSCLSPLPPCSNRFSPVSLKRELPLCTLFTDARYVLCLYPRAGVSIEMKVPTIPSLL